jgi:hypothetical protein
VFEHVIVPLMPFIFVFGVTGHGFVPAVLCVILLLRVSIFLQKVIVGVWVILRLGPLRQAPDPYVLFFGS